MDTLRTLEVSIKIVEAQKALEVLREKLTEANASNAQVQMVMNAEQAIDAVTRSLRAIDETTR